MTVQGFSANQMDFDQVRMTQKTDKLERMLEGKASGPGGKDEETWKAAREFESFFLYYMIKVMRETVQESDLFGDRKAEKIYRSMQDEKMADSLADRGGIGLAEMIYKKLRQESSAHSLPGAGGFESWNISEHGENGKPERVPAMTGEMTSGFGRRWDPITGERGWHNGVDLAMALGAPVRAAEKGEVVFSGRMKGYGNVVVLKHPGNLETVYAHNQSNEFQVGKEVQRGEIIARVGESGRATGPHLHFEVRKNGISVDPRRFVRIMEVEKL